MNYVLEKEGNVKVHLQIISAFVLMGKYIDAIVVGNVQILRWIPKRSQGVGAQDFRVM